MRVNNPLGGVSAIGLTLIFGLLLVAACGGQRSGEEQEAGDDSIAAIPPQTDERPMASAARMKAGEVVYGQHCATCHQHKGEGVSNLNPPLIQTDYVTGDVDRLIRIVLHGSNVGLEVNGMVYSNAMPANMFLSDQEVADVLSYIRNSFGNRAEAISVDEVSRVRASLE